MPHSAAAGVRPAAITAAGWGWRHAGRARPALRNLDLEIRPGERVLLLGASGAGKSTLLHAMAGVLGEDDGHAESGRLLLDGRPAADQRGRAGLVQQDPDSQVVLSRVGDDVAFGAENLAVPRAEIWARVTESLAAVGLRLPLRQPTAALSGGQKQRLALAGVLAMRPGALLLDEPTANLDPGGVLQVRDAVTAALERTGATLVVVEHRVAVWADVVDRVVVLTPDGVLADGAPRQVLDRARSALIDAGIWVPGYVPPVRPRAVAAEDPPVLLSARDLAVSPEPGRRRHPAPPVAAGIEVRVREGRALSVTGPNGVGKSTLALTLAGLLPAHGGAVVAGPRLREHGAAGRPAAGPTPSAWSSGELITRIGTVFQNPEHQFVTGRVRDELTFGPRQLARTTPRRHRRDVPREAAALAPRTDELMERLRLTHLGEANPFTLSGGEKRRLSVATVLAASPAVLVLDEPTFGQDATTWRELASLLTELLDAGTAAVCVTHDVEFTAALGGDRLHLGRPDTAAPVPAPGVA
ncbi:ABC transporter ATP-binding protein [Georgenia ruanii]|uniref:ATP-binding cassette domain-containing protein n=1 Tax=Georgenia ruanii TaxID=348442 RepID=A0A7J9URH6_9MICO|nr:ATP-binding cassette domain-containing protein [Georgenia ruanii]MPV87216.1 ATP-binding cassette domain-containing protein [Georgenia ruanii]